jgi:hypothetical protein
MRPLQLLILVLALATPASAEYLRIVPPAPDSDDPVVLEAGGIWSDSCVPGSPSISRLGSQIDVTLTVRSGGGCLLATTPWQQYIPVGTLSAGVYSARVLIASSATVPPRVAGTLVFPVSDSEAAFDLTPQAGAAAGGTDVFIRGEFGTCPIAPPCFVPQVYFGGVAAQDVREVTGGIIVRTPAHAAGIVDVEVRGRAGTPLATLPAAYTFAAAGRPDLAAYTPVLFPLIFSGPGSQGSDWVTEASAYNEGRVAVTPLDREAVTTCPPNVSPCPAPAFAAGAWGDFHFGASYPTGLILWIPRSQEDDLHFALHARDRSRATQNLGAEVPVIREEELRGSEVHLLNIPIRSGFRQMLRVYDLGPANDPNVFVSMYSRTNQLLGSVTLRLSSPDESCLTGQSPCTPRRPRYAALNDFLPQVAPAGIDSVRLVIRSQDPGARLWAFVSSTNNETQLFTTITPQ